MKTVANMGELRQQAARQGAMVEVDGQRFNAAGATVTPQPRPRPPAPTPAPPPIDYGAHVERIAAAITAMSAANYEATQSLGERMAAMVRALPVSAPTAQAPARVYTFRVNRDANGLIESVIATPAA